MQLSDNIIREAIFQSIHEFLIEDNQKKIKSGEISLDDALKELDDKEKKQNDTANEQNRNDTKYAAREYNGGRLGRAIAEKSKEGRIARELAPYVEELGRKLRKLGIDNRVFESLIIEDKYGKKGAKRQKKAKLTAKNTEIIANALNNRARVTGDPEQAKKLSNTLNNFTKKAKKHGIDIKPKNEKKMKPGEISLDDAIKELDDKEQQQNTQQQPTSNTQQQQPTGATQQQQTSGNTQQQTSGNTQQGQQQQQTSGGTNTAQKGSRASYTLNDANATLNAATYALRNIRMTARRYIQKYSNIPLAESSGSQIGVTLGSDFKNYWRQNMQRGANLVNKLNQYQQERWNKREELKALMRTILAFEKAYQELVKISKTDLTRNGEDIRKTSWTSEKIENFITSMKQEKVFDVIEGMKQILVKYIG